VPELQFFFDESIEKQDRIEQILQDLERERGEQAGGRRQRRAPGRNA
jgi:hypothetical protein